MKLDRETRMTMSTLARHGQTRRAIARILGVDESTVRYHLKRQQGNAIDGRSRQAHKAAGLKDAIAHYLAQVEDGPVNLASLHEWPHNELFREEEATDGRRHDPENPRASYARGQSSQIRDPRQRTLPTEHGHAARRRATGATRE